MNSQRSLEAACELHNPISTAYQFHLSCLEVPVTHALSCVHTAQHIRNTLHLPAFFVLCQRRVKHSEVQHLALCPADAFFHMKKKCYQQRSALLTGLHSDI